MKKKRHELILKLIEEHEITTQEELLLLLQKNGFPVTQATVSRDIKELQLVKSPGRNGQTKYMVSHHETMKSQEKKFYAIFSQSVISVDYAGNICAVKCYAGTANAAGAAIDAMDLSDIVGTLAGDDTLFVLCRTEESTKNLRSQLETMLNGEA